MPFQVQAGEAFLARPSDTFPLYFYARANKYDSNYYADDPKKVAYGPDDEVRRNLWVNNVVYELPFGNGKRLGEMGPRCRRVIGGWQVAGTINWGGGLPWTPGIRARLYLEEDVGVCRPNKAREPSTLERALRCCYANGYFLHASSDYRQIAIYRGQRFSDPGLNNSATSGMTVSGGRGCLRGVPRL